MSVEAVSGIVRVTSFPVAEVRVVVNAVPSFDWIFPFALTVNIVVPEAEAVIKLPLFILLTINVAIPPIPAFIYRGAITELSIVDAI